MSPPALNVPRDRSEFMTGGGGIDPRDWSKTNNIVIYIVRMKPPACRTSPPASRWGRKVPPTSFRSVGPKVQPAERKQTHRQTLPKILPLPLTWKVMKKSIWKIGGSLSPWS